MVEWLAPTFNQHKKRLFGAVRASHQSELYLNKMREKHSSGNFPSFIESLTGYHGFKGLWLEVSFQSSKSSFARSHDDAWLMLT